MAVTEEKTYEKLISYIENKILKKEFVVGDKLPAERELAVMLNISRNSVREGIKILERIGVIYSQHGAGNYISNNFDNTLTEVLSMMYILKDMDKMEITDFRFGLEYIAIRLASQYIKEDQKERLKKHLKIMESSVSEEVKAKSDRELHYLIVESSCNVYLISTFNALNNIMELYVPEMREKIFAGKNEKALAKSHHDLVYGICENDTEKAIDAITNHFMFIRKHM